jgi:hypothetical protein
MIMKLVLDNRTGPKNLNIITSDGSLADAHILAKRLDGSRHTLLSVQRAKDDTLMIGGGPKSFIISRTLPDGTSMTLIADLVATGRQEICVGGQFGDFHSRYVCDEKLMKQALIEYYDCKKGSLNWRAD